MQNRLYAKWFQKLQKQYQAVQARGWMWDHEILPYYTAAQGTTVFLPTQVLIRCENNMGAPCFVTLPAKSEDTVQLFAQRLGLPAHLLRFYVLADAKFQPWRHYLSEEDFQNPTWRFELFNANHILYRELVPNEFHFWVHHVLKQMKFPFELTQQTLVKLQSQPTAEVHFWLLRQYRMCTIRISALCLLSRRSSFPVYEMCILLETYVQAQVQQKTTISKLSWKSHQYDKDGQRQPRPFPEDKLGWRKPKLRKYPIKYGGISCGGVYLYFLASQSEGCIVPGSTDYALRTKLPPKSQAHRKSPRNVYQQPRRSQHKQQQSKNFKR